MSNQVLCNALYERGYQLYQKAFHEIDSKITIDTSRKFVDEDYYRSFSLSELTRLAESGNQEAQYSLGDYYAEQNNTASALHWLERSADQGAGCVDAMETLSALYIFGVSGFPKDPQKALRWLKLAMSKGCSAYTMELMCDLYLSKDTPNYSDCSEVLLWLMYFANWIRNDPNKGLQTVVRVINVLQVLIEVDLIGAKEDPQLFSYQNIENNALLCYYWQGVVQNLGQHPNDPDAVSTGDILCQIGECAYAMRRPDAKAILREAMEFGSDYAAVLLIPDAIDKAMNIKNTQMGPTLYRIVDYQVFASPCITPNQIKAANSYVQDYFPKVERAANGSKYGGSRKAEALYRLSHCYLFGLCCKRNVNAAHDCLERAAKLDHNGAKKLLSHFHRKFPFGWEFH